MEEDDRLPFQFVGNTTKSLALDPKEFRGQAVPQLTEEIKRLLSEIAPDVSFFDDDIALAAEALQAAANE